ncbi:leucine--tRNA ligase [Candidatus Desantisbacteria bacterium CG1_02_38_46]|uniref:Leucine--tRNA ligase n=3 Tax=unclassified Candidatus Desantisiibacteriota TaxID=3106372 RepID=A0A2H9P9N9_9BACT|nr:MAG: leucine--tRNA ligase [Candidatus Desantisbacteria bacterium CG1_02_38_46]PIU50817.1 MAG: leucine--tRNA ligase [Candidatus Desantisbacteria bacterium CG07_land_8_20_14_0_80_39_15]PIZ15035.1 MAG: leucine--tRNA ligase [Candidatus Desantisbacteria bacterium CG_4_10_14_0_8_um_filter_39_17]
MEDKYPFAEIEYKWQKYWEQHKIYEVEKDSSKEKYYVLEMFPYPSATLHVGHTRPYSITDVIARFKLLQGFNVLHPVGYDSFGMPAEISAFERSMHPATWTYQCIDNIRAQFKRLGFSYDWRREIITCEPSYYRWNQWFFLKFYEKGLAYRKKTPANWCSKCETVLANEQVIDGQCWRCNTKVEQKNLEQWFLSITSYAERLLDTSNLKEWPERVLLMQKNWIGRSEGVEIKFKIKNEELPVFTTRPDTIFGATYVVLSPEHPLVNNIIHLSKSRGLIKKFVEKAKSKDMTIATILDMEKEGIWTGFYAVNPVNNEKIPIWVANYVLTEYGTGAIMAVPTHDQRDFEFAKKYGLPMRIVIQKQTSDSKLQNVEEMTQSYEGEGVLVNSGQFNGLENKQAIDKIGIWMEQQGIGERKVYYKLRDWCISRQRYWGTPIPIVYCEKCGIVAVPENDLPVKLPKKITITRKGQSPLAYVEEFVNCTCPKCRGRARRETDTMDTFVCSSWYFLRYTSINSEKVPFNLEDVNYWMPVEQYVGGVEHAILHLLYARFFNKFLKDIGMVNNEEPFTNLLVHGMVIKDGAKMSKSKGNVVSPDEIIERYGADVLRLFMLFAAPPQPDLEWSDEGIEGANRFLNRVWRLVKQVVESEKCGGQENQRILRKLHHTIKKVTEDIERFHFNTAIASIMELINTVQQSSPIRKEILETIVLLLSPFVPHICEEMWESMGNKPSIFNQSWPKYNPELIKEEETLIIIQVNGRVRDKMLVPSGISEEDVRKMVLNREKVRKWTGGKTIENIIFIPDKLINIVV